MSLTTASWRISWASSWDLVCWRAKRKSFGACSSSQERQALEAGVFSVGASIADIIFKGGVKGAFSVGGFVQKSLGVR